MNDTTARFSKAADRAETREGFLAARREEARAPEIREFDSTVRVGEEISLVLGPRIPMHALQQLGPYKLLQQLGSGGMGIVFEVEDTISGAHFALKVLRPSLALEPEAKVRFFREARAMATVGHQRIIPVIRVGEDRGIPYIAMPLLQGETLEARLNRSPDLTIEEILRIGAEIAEGLNAAHQRGLIHRDVKPANVWLEAPTGSVRLLDLGLAREIDKGSLLTNSGIVMGTPSYMSPEQARGETLDGRSDLFSLGCILYQMATGERPFAGKSPLMVLAQLEIHHPTRVSAKNRAAPTLLSNLIMELLAKNPKDRPATAEIVMERLRRVPLVDSRRASQTKDDWSESSASREEPLNSDWDIAMRTRRPIMVFVLLAIGACIGYFASQ